MRRIRQQTKLPTDLVKELLKIKDVKNRSVWRKQFKNDYAVMEMLEENIRNATELPETDKYKLRLVKRLPEIEGKLKNIKERIARYQENLKEYINGDQECISKYHLLF